MKNKIVYNKKYDIFTKHGFVDFDGIGKFGEKEKILRIVLTNKNLLDVSMNHIFIVDDKEIYAKNLNLGDYLETEQGDFEIIDINLLDDEYFVYDILDVKSNDNSYYVNGINSHNCKFLGSSNTLIETDTLETIEFQLPIDYKWNGLFRIYEHPIEGQLYILGIDTAKGTGKDNSVIQVLRVISEQDIRQVAVYMNNRIDTHDYAQVCIAISEYYNGGYMMIENNSEGGETANVIWHEYENENILNCDKVGLGIRSTKTSKLKANLNLKRYLENKWLHLVDKETVNELSKYVEISPNVFRSETKTTPDDHVTSLLWGLFFVTTDFFDDRDISVKTLDEKYKLDDEDKPIFYFSD